MSTSRVRRHVRTSITLITAVGGLAAGFSTPTPAVPAAAVTSGLEAAERVDAAAVRAAAAAPTAEAPAAQPAAFARLGEAELVSPSDAKLLIGFHESGEAAPLDLHPIGDEQPQKVLPSRGRGTSPTSAVDIALPAGEDVASVVTGEVVQVASYTLYGTTTDDMVVIRPDQAPGTLVRMLHLDEVVAEVGQRVEAGETIVAGTARVLPFGSQIDRHTGHRHPHVHVDAVRG